jgi:hypothetical protein
MVWGSKKWGDNCSGPLERNVYRVNHAGGGQELDGGMRSRPSRSANRPARRKSEIDVVEGANVCVFQMICTYVQQWSSCIRIEWIACVKRNALLFGAFATECSDQPELQNEVLSATKTCTHLMCLASEELSTSWDSEKRFSRTISLRLWLERFVLLLLLFDEPSDLYCAL